MNYTSKHFTNCVFNPLVNGAVLKAYPELKQHLKDEWAEDDNFDSILRYVIAVYDPKSPLVREQDLNKRKEDAARIVGFDFTEEIKAQIFNSTYPSLPEKQAWVDELIFMYLKQFVKSREWAAIVALEFAYWEQIKQLMAPIVGKTSADELAAVQKKAIVSNELGEMLKRVATYRSLFFDEDIQLEQAVMQTKKRFDPQAIAKAHKK